MKMRFALLIATSLLAGCVTYEPTNPESYPRVSTANPPPAMGAGIYLSAYPELDVVPGYPVYYAPQVDGNYFFYDGLYWVFQGDNWYASSWYSGPWDLVDREYVPPYVLRVPVRYYRQPPSYFRGWRPDAAPRWAEHWGRDWEQRRSGWDQWDRRSPPPPAPLPVYQGQYSGDRYPRVPQQQYSIRSEHYRYQPIDPITLQRFQQREEPAQQRYPDHQQQQGQERQQRLEQQRQQQQEQERQQRLEQQRQQQQEQERQQRLEQQRQQQQGQERQQRLEQQRQQQQEQERQQRLEQLRQQQQGQERQQRRQEQDYGSELMTPKENAEYRARMQAVKTAEEREQIRKEHHEKMKERAKARGVTLPDEPPAGGDGMGPNDGGMRPGGGRNR